MVVTKAGVWRLLRTVVVFGVAAALAVVVAGCDGEAAKQEDRRPPMDSIVTEIQAALAKRPDVASAEVRYADNLTSSGTVYVNITVKAGADFAPVRDEAIRLVWQSELELLHNIDVGLIDAVDKLRGENVYIDPDGKDKAELEQKYGPRPK